MDKEIQQAIDAQIEVTRTVARGELKLKVIKLVEESISDPETKKFLIDKVRNL